MFRTSNKRGQKRFDTITSSKKSAVGKRLLSKKQIALIENSEILNLGEKIELLLVSLGNKLTTELYLNIDYRWSEIEQKELPNKKKVDLIKKLLDSLPFIYFQDHLPKKNRQNNNPQAFTWFQVSINERVSDFMKKYPDDLTEFEEGVLYGYPLSAIRAFTGLIEPSHKKLTVASHFLAGVCSKDFWEDEQAYYELWWERLRKLSPKIVEGAEVKFNKQMSSKQKGF